LHYQRLQSTNGALAQRRQQQALAWMWERIQAGLRQQFDHHPGVRQRLAGFTEQVGQGRLAASTAARELLACFSLGPAAPSQASEHGDT